MGVEGGVGDRETGVSLGLFEGRLPQRIVGSSRAL